MEVLSVDIKQKLRSLLKVIKAFDVICKKLHFNISINKNDVHYCSFLNEYGTGIVPHLNETKLVGGEIWINDKFVRYLIEGQNYYHSSIVNMMIKRIDKDDTCISVEYEQQTKYGLVKYFGNGFEPKLMKNVYNNSVEYFAETVGSSLFIPNHEAPCD